MVGKGSVNHNSRKFIASNVDKERTYLNTDYVNENIKNVYRELFGEALEKYNARQNRSDRIIKNYYEKIANSKQEKLFHEVIFQIGNKDDMSSSGEYAKLAKKILEEYYHGFQEKNPTLRVFSAHLHMDEATPHLHIDFVPFTTNSKQGLETRVSLKKALSSLGFTGGTRSETEWNQWIAHEKTVLAEVMERNGITWLKKGTHEKHLSVLEYEKKMRTQEVEELENNISKLTTEEQAIKTNLEELKKSEALLELNVKKYDTDKEWLLPESAPMVSVKNYIEKKVKPFVEKLKNVIKSLVYQYLELKKSYDSLNTAYWKVKSDYHAIEGRLYELGEENKDLRKITNEYRLLRKSIGEEKVTEILNKSSGRKQKAKDTFSK